MGEKKLRWDPVRAEARYCAPACGLGCTYEQYKAAVRRARALAKRLGSDWNGDVWENLGWHYRAVSSCKRFKVHSDGDKIFTAFLGDADSSGGFWSATATTPKMALRQALHKAQEEVQRLTAVLTDLPPI